MPQFKYVFLSITGIAYIGLISFIILLGLAPKIKYDPMVTDAFEQMEKLPDKTKIIKNYKFMGIGLNGYNLCYIYRLGFPMDASDREFLYKKSIWSSSAMYGFFDGN